MIAKVRNVARTVRDFYDWLVREGYLHPDPWHIPTWRRGR